MKKPIKRLLQQRRFLLITGLIVSLLAISQTSIYSKTDIQQYLPGIENVKNEFNQRLTTKNQPESNNLTSQNFIASYIRIISNRPDKTENENCEKGNVLTIFKNKVNKIFSSF